MKVLEDSTGEKRNLRTIGVAKKDNPVSVKQNNNGENIAGEWFSSIVVRVVANPKFGSDEISNAAGDSWVGKNGYLKPDGKRQMARAFIGTVRNKNGESVDEVFIVDIPNEIDVEGEYGALEGTKNVLPMPPKGATQRRLTFTAESESAGCIGIVRSSPEGDLLAFLAKDKQNVRQIFTINPNGENLNQITFHKTDVEGSLRWHPSGKSVFYICAGSIHQCEIGFGDFETRVQQISKPSYISPTNLVVSHDGKILAFNRAITRGDGAKHSKQIYIIKLND
jgi:Tol biopolymer transport system component